MNIKRLSYILGGAGLLFFMFLSCGKEYPFATEADCNDCISPKPSEGAFIITLSPNQSDSDIVVKIYKGKISDIDKLMNTGPFSIDTVPGSQSEVDVDVPLDEYYAVVAEYYKGGKLYRVVDGDKIKLYSITQTCNSDCWIIRGGKVNCRLKF